MYSNYTAHIILNGSHFLMVEFLVYCTYKIRKMGTSNTVRDTMHSKTKYTVHISPNGSHFLTVGFLFYCTYRIRKNGYIGHS